MIDNQTERHKGDILITDNDLPSLDTLSSILTTEGYKVRGVPDGQTALTVVENKPPVDDEIDETLESLGRFLRTERSFLAQFSENADHLVFTNIGATEKSRTRSQIFGMDIAFILVRMEILS